MIADITVRAMTGTGLSMPVRAASATRAVALASAARARPVRSRASTSREAGNPAMTTRRSVSRVAAIWKYIAMSARNAAA
ncbi:MAG: hypothetical protein HHJ11_13365 [Phycicoccus sp.]|nr:hypothetical protein [Phycicoccus sp.]NMM33121.1 hypothetical protein [Phycicoccus sp.]